MNERLLVDECLTPELGPIACELGFEAYHVAHSGSAVSPIALCDPFVPAVFCRAPHGCGDVPTSL
jgi:hypothetical protein